MLMNDVLFHQARSYMNTRASPSYGFLPLDDMIRPGVCQRIGMLTTSFDNELRMRASNMIANFENSFPRLSSRDERISMCNTHFH
jgi:hypothetical protein